jgi:RHS repeat-associated protein
MADSGGQGCHHPKGMNPLNHIFAYDAENRQVSANVGMAQLNATYEYDGDGRRVKRLQNGHTTVFVYDASGRLMAEYSTETPSAFGTSYITADHLSSTRIVTDATGNVQKRQDYYPFGEEIASAFGGRSSVAGYSATTSIRQKFTGKERDAESGLDFFLSRYYSPAPGRFTSPDPYNAILMKQNARVAGFPEATAQNQFDQFLENPQNLNAYSYVRNNPLAFIDPWGALPREPDGHHLIPYRKDLTLLAKEFANAVKTGRDGMGPPNQPGYGKLHRAYNAAAEDILRQFEARFGAGRNSWSLTQWRQAATGLLNSNHPAIRNFLDLLNKNNAGKAIPALAAAIQTYRASPALVARVIGLGLLRILRAPIIVYIPPGTVTVDIKYQY